MQVTVSVTLDVSASGTVADWEPQIEEAGRLAMRTALAETVWRAQDEQRVCSRCGLETLVHLGTRGRILRTSFGVVPVRVLRVRCSSCTAQDDPAAAMLAPLSAGGQTPRLQQWAATLGAGFPFATAERVLAELAGATLSAETIRHDTLREGTIVATRERAAAQAACAPTAAMIRAERTDFLTGATPAPAAPVPERLLVGMDGGWIPCRDQPGGMEGKVAVVATGCEPVGKTGRQRLTPRRYVATFGSSSELGVLAAAAAIALRGLEAVLQFVLGDGAGWIKTETATHFPAAIGVLDWPHLERVVRRAIRVARPGAAQRGTRFLLYQTIFPLLRKGQTEAARRVLTLLRPDPPVEAPAALSAALTYLETQRDWIIDYDAQAAQGHPIASGLVEREVALVINRRMKRQGMRWLRDNATAVVALRVDVMNQTWQARDRLLQVA